MQVCSHVCVCIRVNSMQPGGVCVCVLVPPGVCALRGNNYTLAIVCSAAPQYEHKLQHGNKYNKKNEEKNNLTNGHVILWVSKRKSQSVSQ